MSGHSHAWASLPCRKISGSPFVQEIVLGPEPVRMVRRMDRPLSLPEIETCFFGCPAGNLTVTQIVVSLLFLLNYIFYLTLKRIILYFRDKL